MRIGLRILTELIEENMEAQTPSGAVDNNATVATVPKKWQGTKKEKKVKKPTVVARPGSKNSIVNQAQDDQVMGV